MIWIFDVIVRYDAGALLDTYGNSMEVPLLGTYNTDMIIYYLTFMGGCHLFSGLTDADTVMRGGEGYQLVSGFGIKEGSAIAV